MTTERQAGSADALRVSAFPDGQRLWRIAWLGSIRFADRMLKTTQPSVLVHLSEVLDPRVRHDLDAPISPDALATKQTKRWVSVGTSVLLRHGDLWEGQRFLHRPALEMAEFLDVEISDETAKVVKAGSSLDEGDFLIPFAEHPWHSENTHSYCVRLTLPDGRYLVIPAMELIRFYFGSSAKLLSLLFKPALAREDLYEQMRLNRITRRMSLSLASGIPRASVEDIARIAGDPRAWSAAQYVGASCLRSSTRQVDVYPVAHFPFRGMTHLKAYGQWLSRGADERGTFLVYRLASCSHAFPFKSLTFQLKGQRPRSVRRPWPDLEDARQARGARAAPPERPTLEERDASSQLKPHNYSFRGERVFPYLEGKFICGERKVEPGSAVGVGARTEPVSALAVGDPGSSGRRREAQLTEDHRSPPDKMPAFLKPAVEACARLDGMDVQWLTCGPEDSWTLPVALLLDADGVIEDALLMDETVQSRPRRFAAVLISREPDRLIAVFTESDPMYPLAYPAERGDEEEAHDTMICAARDFLRRVRGSGAPDLAIPVGDMSAVETIRAWIGAFF